MASSNPPKAPAKAKDSFGSAAPWLKFLAVLGYIGVAILLVVGAAFIVVGLVLHNAFRFHLLGMLGPVLGLFYVILAVVIYFLVRILMRLAKASKLYGGLQAPRPTWTR
jgi:Ca2+/Na+ antiporter